MILCMADISRLNIMMTLYSIPLQVSYTSMSGVYSMVSSSTRSSLAARSSFGYVPNNNIIEGNLRRTEPCTADKKLI